MAQRDSLKAGGESGQGLGSIDLPDPPAFRGYPLLGLGRLLTRVRARLEHSRLDAALAQRADPVQVARPGASRCPADQWA